MKHNRDELEDRVTTLVSSINTLVELYDRNHLEMLIDTIVDRLLKVDFELTDKKILIETFDVIKNHF